MIEFDNPFVGVAYTRRDSVRFNKLAKSWSVLAKQLNTLSEVDLIKLYNWEKDNKHRNHVLDRIKMRHNRVRDEREREELKCDRITVRKVPAETRTFRRRSVSKAKSKLVSKHTR